VNVPDSPAALWAAWLVRGGLEPEKVTLTGDFAAVARGDVPRPSDPVAALARFGGFELEVARALHRSWGDAAAALLVASRDRAPFSVRTNRRRGDRDALIARLAAEGRQPRPSTVGVDAVICAPFDVHTSAAWRDGAFEVQDEGSQLVAPVVDPKPGERIVDWCAGGGGKSLHLAGLAACEVIARDDGRPHALAEVARRAARAHVRVRVDGGAVAPRSADAVLVDAPCSGTGTLRRRPELRLGLDGAEIARLVALQGRILDEAAVAVREGGRLVYATCSVLQDENDDVVAAFLARTPEFTLGVAPGANDGPVVRLAPHLHGTDGFYAAVLIRGASSG
jgi:16S rRNA (cytosine967-C5)-methyltransferase